MGGLLLLFPGQGSQAVGMGHHLWETFGVARDTFREAEDLLGWDLRGLCLRGPMDRLTRTDNAQVAIFVCSIATWRVLEDRDVCFDVAAGHSLGEYSALVAAGHLTFADALKVVTARGQAMLRCGEELAGTMAAIVGLSDAEATALCGRLEGVWPANFNCPGQVVISGTPEAVAAAGELARELGAKRVIPLQVSGAFHSPLVAGAAQELARVLDEVEVRPARQGRFFSTTEVGYPEVSQIRDVMVRQLTSPVRFTQSIEALLPEVTSGVEVGPGGVLAGLVKRVAARFPVYGTDNGASLEDAFNHAIVC
jgi:[acyl-carrier-protein] S-malonyltransferase